MAADATLRDRLELGLDAPICLTWELTWACNLACVHCLSSSGRRDPDELSTAEARAVIDELASMRVFYVNVGGGEPTIRKRIDSRPMNSCRRGLDRRTPCDSVWPPIASSPRLR